MQGLAGCNLADLQNQRIRDYIHGTVRYWGEASKVSGREQVGTRLSTTEAYHNWQKAAKRGLHPACQHANLIPPPTRNHGQKARE